MRVKLWVVFGAWLAGCGAILPVSGAAEPPLLLAQDAWRGPSPLPGDRAPRRGGQLRDPLAPPPITLPDPLAERDRAIKRLFGDPGRRVGLPPQPNLNQPGEAAPPPAELTLPTEVQRLDRNHDGAVSRDEYFRGRTRMVPVGPAGDARQRQLQERLDSRFRDADRDRSGTVTPQELDQYGSPRF